MNLNNIDLNTYKTFYTVAKSQSFSKASEILYISQPAVSTAIKKLEEQLEVKLFKRDNRGIQLTEYGEKLYFYVETIFNTLNVAEKKLKEDKDLTKGEVRIGVPSHIGLFLVNEMIAEFKNLYPGVKFRIENRSTKDMLNMLSKREIDIIIDNAPIESDNFSIETVNLMSFDNCFVADKKYEKLASEPIDFNTLNNYQLLLPAERTSTRLALENEVKKENSGLSLKPIIEVSTTETMYDLVKRGLGIGYFTRMSVIKDIISGSLYEIKTKNELPKTEVCIAYLPDFLTNSSLQFINYVKEQTRKKKIRSNKELRIIITKDCNYNCYFCHHEGIKNELSKNLNEDEILWFYKFLKNTYNILSVHITGGEPFLNKNFLNILKKLKEANAEITVTSNGYLINPSDNIFNYIDKINISIHSIDEKSYEKISNVSESYQKVLSNIIELRKNYPLLKIGINTTLVKTFENNHEELIKLIEFSKSLRADIKIIELFPNDDVENFLDISSIVPILINKKYLLKQNIFRKKIYENDNHKVILTKCTCSAVDERVKENYNNDCYENNDIYFSIDGKLYICRKNESNENIIKIFDEIKSLDINETKIKMENYFESLGKNCIYK